MISYILLVKELKHRTVTLQMSHRKISFVHMAYSKIGDCKKVKEKV